MPKNLTVIDLFAGAGGLSEGFIRTGFKPVAHVEADKAACNTLRTRAVYHWLKSEGRLDIYTQYLRKEITRAELYEMAPPKVLDSVIETEIGPETNAETFSRIHRLRSRKSIDVIIGGPPCQAYSLIGRSASSSKMVGDPRNHLYIQYVEFLKEFKPKYFVFENVTGLLSAKDESGGKYLDLITAAFDDAGYKIAYRTIDASDHGVPQHRKRVIIIGKRGKNKFAFPEIEKMSPPCTLKKLFSDLPSIHAGEEKYKYLKRDTTQEEHLSFLGLAEPGIELPLTLHVARPHQPRDLEIYELAATEWRDNKRRIHYPELPKRLQTHKNTKSFVDRFKVVAWERKASHTVVAHIAKDGHYYIHPSVKQNRSLSPREAARLQTFPDDFYFEGISDQQSRTAAFKQIGNAVPVLLSQKIAKSMRNPKGSNVKYKDLTTD
jgi:DNA (cytosine-5)-methyltransferase 1